jgi:hypothetical protein
MAIADKTRKILWGRSGNRCAICRRELVMDATAHDDESVVGEECHIVAREPDGPRGHAELSVEERDSYENLILLCRIHHKLIDDQPHTCDSDYLKAMRSSHEAWVREKLSAKPAGQVAPAPFFAWRMSSGKQVLDVIGGSDAYHFDNDQPSDDYEADLVGSFLQSLQDYGDIWGDLEARDRISAQLEVDRQVQELREQGFLLYGCQRKQKMRSGDRALDWIIAYVLAFRKSNPIVQRREAEVEQILNVDQHDEFSSFVVVRRG